MNKISKIKIILIFIAIIVVLFGVYSIFIHPVSNNTPLNPVGDSEESKGNQPQNTENGFIDSKKISGPRVGSPDTEIIFKSVSPSTKSIPGMDTENSEIQTDTVNLIAGDINLKLDFTQGQTFYEILQVQQEASKITFAGKNYTGLGFFVTDIGNLHAGNGKNLLYYVNGIEASLGVSRYVPKIDDLIEWKLE